MSKLPRVILDVLVLAGEERLARSPKFERVSAALLGQAVDQVPASLWGHDYLKEWWPEGLAQSMLDFHFRFDWDFMKVNPRATYYVEDWGCRFEPSGDPHKGPAYTRYAIQTADDLDRLEPVDPGKGAYGEQLHALELIARGLTGDAPFTQTVFSPLSVASRLLEGREEAIKGFMRESPEALKRALSAIAATLAPYARACLEKGATGIFFATTSWATRELISDAEYLEFGRPYDLQVLAAVPDAEFNVLHVCRENNMLDLLADYPVHAISWDARAPKNPDLARGLTMMSKAAIGGVSHEGTLPQGPPEAVRTEVIDALEQTRGKRVLIGPGCSIPTTVPEGHIRAVRGAVASWRSEKVKSD